MANLPPERCDPGKAPFSYTGIDCFGAFYVRQGRSEIKRYGCVFTCLTTRALHIEKLNNMDTDSFLNGLMRFGSRRGWPEKIWSDNGTNFVGGQSELSRALKDIEWKKIHNFCLRKEVNWSFNPPGASHMGGIWERMIRTIRKVMSAILSQRSRLTDEVLETLFCEVESIVNSRPLTKISDDIEDSNPLTPNHLLLLKEGPIFPPGRFTEGDMYRRRWRYVQFLADQLLRKWIREYIPELQKRNKWDKLEENLKIGDLVLITEENTPRGLWPLGRIVDVKLGRDQMVRSVMIKTRSNELVRPITKVVLLEASNQDFEI